MNDYPKKMAIWQSISTKHRDHEFFLMKIISKMAIRQVFIHAI